MFVLLWGESLVYFSLPFLPLSLHFAFIWLFAYKYDVFPLGS